MGSPEGILHKIMVLSIDPDAKYFPFGENDILFTQEEWA